MTSNNVSSLIKTACLQVIQSILLNTIMDNVLPMMKNIFRYLSLFGVMKMLLYLLFLCVLVFILYKLYTFIKNLYKSFKINSESNSSNSLVHYNKNKKIKNNLHILSSGNKSNSSKSSSEISSFISKTTDFNLEPKQKIIHKTSSESSEISKKYKRKSKSEPLISSSF